MTAGRARFEELRAMFNAVMELDHDDHCLAHTDPSLCTCPLADVTDLLSDRLLVLAETMDGGRER